MWCYVARPRGILYCSVMHCAMCCAVLWSVHWCLIQVSAVQMLYAMASSCRCFVVGKDVANRVVYVTEGGAGPDHPALFTQTALLHSPHWISGRAPLALGKGLPFECSFKARYRQPDRACQVASADANTPEADAAHMGRSCAPHFQSSRFTNLLKVGCQGSAETL